jgi:hypothetical protein
MMIPCPIYAGDKDSAHKYWLFRYGEKIGRDESIGRKYETIVYH